MVEEFVKIWDNHKDELRSKYSEKHPDDYSDIVNDLIELLNKYCGDYEKPDPSRVTRIDHGDYQGYLLWIIGATGYQPSKYWATSSYYGSCSGCDTFQAIRSGWDWDAAPNGEEIEGYMTLALHLLQAFREV